MLSYDIREGLISIKNFKTLFYCGPTLKSYKTLFKKFSTSKKEKMPQSKNFICVAVFQLVRKKHVEYFRNFYFNKIHCLPKKVKI